MFHKYKVGNDCIYIFLDEIYPDCAVSVPRSLSLFSSFSLNLLAESRMEHKHRSQNHALDSFSLPVDKRVKQQVMQVGNTIARDVIGKQTAQVSMMTN